MLECNCLIHPFQHDPGTSQHQRIMDELLKDAAKIDARTLADLLDYFVQLSRHINFYDQELNSKDWQPFFKNSIPFTIASIIKYNTEDVESSFVLYYSLFEKKPSPTGLQLNAFFIYYRFISKINEWHLTLKGSGLPLESMMDNLIRSKLNQPVKRFIQYANAAVKAYGIKRIDFLKLYENKVWNIDLADLYAIDTSFSNGSKSKFKRINNLHGNFKSLFPVFLDAIKLLTAEAEKNLEPSFFPLKEELQKKHQPHLALLFAFLNMFRQLQDDLNQYTHKHLDFFYKDILKFKSAGAVPDKAHVIFEIQKNLKSYMLKKGLKVKNGKDDNKQEILFSLDDDIVVTKTTIADKRTLFLNNQICNAQTYVEGVYMAPAADKADGLEKEFKDEPRNFPTAGAKHSKYADPETKLIKPYPNGRLGFILGSPVLFLQAGSTRKIVINLDCCIDDLVCEKTVQSDSSDKNCCSENNKTGSKSEKEKYPDFFPGVDFFDKVNTVLSKTYFYFNQDLLKDAVKKGINSGLVAKLREKFLSEESTTDQEQDVEDYCNCQIKKEKYEGIVEESDYNDFFNQEKVLLSEWIKPIKAFRILFSGEKEWFSPDIYSSFNIVPVFLNNRNDNKFTLTITAELTPENPAVTFYDKDKLKEDLGTTQPLVKIELDDRIKIFSILSEQKEKNNHHRDDCCIPKSSCLSKKECGEKNQISLYHFFRSIVVDKVSKPDKGVIEVTVCGLKDFVVQNDESVMDVNGVVFPFGNNPKSGSNFYVSSKEVFCKNWKEFNLKFNWKDKPKKFEDYYHGYEDELSVSKIEKSDFNKDNFLFESSIIENGAWKQNITDKKELFSSDTLSFCAGAENQKFQFKRDYFSLFPYKAKNISCFKKEVFSNSTRDGFLKLTFRPKNDKIDFQQDRYSFVLTRQMMALGKFPEIYRGPVYDGTFPIPLSGTTNVPVFEIGELLDVIINAETLSKHLQRRLSLVIDKIRKKSSSSLPITKISYTKSDLEEALGNPLPDGTSFPFTGNNSLDDASVDNLINYLENSILNPAKNKINEVENIRVVIPNKPYLPQFQNITIDYKAIATIEDVDLIHLYPFAGTYKHEEIELHPTLFPTFCDEGTLFLGLKDLVHGDNLNILFQLAEATSDSESDKEEVFWSYLDSNVWKPLRKGFELIDDATENLTTSGIVKFSLPGNMTKDNTVMPKDLHWIKVSIAKNSKAVSETIKILSQAILTTFTNEAANDKLRLSTPLAAESISKLYEADSSVKSVSQPFESFGGEVPEIENQFYVRVSETLRHKGRAIQSFDYERQVLQAFPQLFKVKCINHSFALNAHEYQNDFPYAPGYVTLAVIPDLSKLKSGNAIEPKVPVSLLEDVDAFVRKRTSPFVRFRTVNPRYEKINFCLKVQLIKGKDENYYSEKLKQDIREFMAPWSVGHYDKLTFGQCIYRSDIIKLLETTNYVDFITDFQMGRENAPPGNKEKVCPDTPRSILISGNVEVCIEEPGCEENKSKCETMPEVFVDYCHKRSEENDD